MAQKTAFTVYGVPGRTQSFLAKSPASASAHNPGWITELGAGGWPGGRHSFSPKSIIAGGTHPVGPLTALASYGVPGRLRAFFAKTSAAEVTAVLDTATGGYWLDNGLVKLLIKPNTMLTKLTLLGLSRDVGYSYLYLDYWTEDNVPGNFYLHTIGSFNITPSSSPLSTAYVVLSKVYTDTNGITHTLSVKVSLAAGKNHAAIEFQDDTSSGLKKLHLNVESNLYPQGYSGQNTGGKFDAGGSTAYTTPAPYDNAVYSFYSKGLIKKDSTDLTTVSTTDGYLACYSSDASVGLFAPYVDINKLRVYTLSTGEERQYAWLDLLPRPSSNKKFKSVFYFGAWNAGSPAHCRISSGSLPYVEELESGQSYQFNKIVRTDLNADLYDYHPKFQDILSKITASAGNATLVPAGTPSFKFYKHRGYSDTWNGTVKDLGEDFLLKSATMAREAGHRLFVEVDILDGTWNTADPTNKAIESDEVTPSYYWPKLNRLITPGQAFHDAFMYHVTYLCRKYNFYGLALSECAYKHVDYSAEAKALFLADNPGYSDWPRKVDGTIDTGDETLGKWKTVKLGAFWDEIKAVTAANNKKFFLMVEPNFWDADRQAWEYGQYWPEAIKHCDGLWVWGYYGSFEVSPDKLGNVSSRLRKLRATYPDKENIVSIGLWDEPSGVITAAELKEGLDALHTYSWFNGGQGVEVTPSKHMTDAHWSVLWGEVTPVIQPLPYYNLHGFNRYRLLQWGGRYKRG